MKIYFRKKSFFLQPIIVNSFLFKATGLMFKFKSKPMLFVFNEDIRYGIHSFFVFFPFLAVWLDKNYKVLEFKIVKPFTFHVVPKKNYRHLLEIPLNTDNKKITEFVVGSKHLNIRRDF